MKATGCSNDTLEEIGNGKKIYATISLGSLSTPLFVSCVEDSQTVEHAANDPASLSASRGGVRLTGKIG